MLTCYTLSFSFETIVFALFVLFALIQLFYFLYYFARFAFYKHEKTEHKDGLNPVSVVICAKNEFDNLKENLPVILEQKYKDFEVIVVNDFSDDDSVHLLNNLKEKYSHLKVVTLRENVNFFAGKKLALAVGIKSAKNDLVLLTDADCKPSSPYWIQNMQKHFDNGAEITLGYSGYYKRPGLLNALIRFDTITIAMQYFSYALAGNPYMGVGRNLAYKKSLFIKAKGFTSHYKVSSGDDDLFINQTANKENTCIEISDGSFTYSKPKAKFSSWFFQKKRHLSTAKFYKAIHKLRLMLYSISQFLFFAAFITLVVISKEILLLILSSGIFLLRWMLLLLLYNKVEQKLKESKLFLYSPLFELVFLFLNPVFLISNLLFKKNKWK